MSRNPSSAGQPQVYQIDFTAVACGKKIASTKRRVRWRFGFANPEALANGQTGTACRGEEHDVTIVWSITSGKRTVLADGKEVHFSSSRNNVFEFSWTMRGNHVLKLLAHSSPPLSVTPGFRQYDFFVDGQSFFTFPKVFRLGLAPNDPRGARSPRAPPNQAERGRNYGTNGTRSTGSGNIATIEAPHNPDEEEAYLREAIKNSLNDNGPKSGASVQSAPVRSSGNDLLLDFAAPAPAPLALPGPAPAPYYGGAAPAPQPGFAALPPSTTSAPLVNGYPAPADPWGSASVGAGSYATAPPPASYQAPAPAYGAAPADPFEAQQGYGAPAPTPDFAAAPPAQNPYGAPAPDFAAAPPAAGPYGAPPPAQPAAPVPGTPQAGTFPAQDFTPTSSLGFASPTATMNPPAAPAPAAPAPSNPALLSMNVLSGQQPQLVTEDMTAGGATAATNGTVADQAYAKLMNMDAFDLVKGSNEQEKANPFDMGTMSNVIKNQTPLSDLKSQNSSQGQQKSVMNAAPPAAGAMVVSNNQQGNFGGYGGQAGMMQQQPMGMGQQPMSGYGMQQQQPMGQQPMGMGMGQQPMGMGQQPMAGYGMQQQQPPMQQQQPQYGQPPPVQQQPYGNQFGGF